MELIDTIAVEHQGITRSIKLFVGDLALLPKEEAVDILIVSAFPDDYTPTRTSLIGALSRAGVSISKLAGEKEVDLRQFSSCWLSREITQPGINFRRVLCFEPGNPGRSNELVGDIFRSIVPFTSGNPPVSQIAMPVVASGDLGESAEVMLEALTDAAVHWLSIGLPLDQIKIVLHNRTNSPSLPQAFSRVKQRHSRVTQHISKDFRFDAFVSYSHKDKETVDDFVDALRKERPSIRIFLDRLELQTGFAWQQHIFDALDESRKVICAFSPEYLKSKVCKEEFNMGLFRHRESADGVLLPVYLYTAPLPTYMKLIQYEDIREGDRTKMSQAVKALVRQL